MEHPVLSPRRFAAALALGLLVRAATLVLPGHEDVNTWKIWSYGASHDVTAMYGNGGTPPTRGVVTWEEVSTTVDYPPFFLYEYAIVGRVYGALFPGYPDSRALLVTVKLPGLLANLGLTALIFFAVRRASRREIPARWAALAYWLNPASLVGGEMLGYLDALCFLPAIAALVLAYFGRPWWGGLLMAIAIATKPEGMLIGPAFAMALWQAGGVADVARAGTTFSLALALIVLPFYGRDAVPNMVLAFGSFAERRDTMSAYAANVGWIINWGLRGWLGLPEFGFPKAFLQQVPRPLAISRFMELGYPDPRPTARVVVIASTAWAMWVARRSRDLAMAAALGAFTIHVFFVLSPGLQEHHQSFEVPLLVLAAALRPGFRLLFVAVSGIVALNINYLYGASLGMGWSVPRMITGVDISVVLAFVNVGVLVWFAIRLGKESTNEPASP
jgi:hypothetical protein